MVELRIKIPEGFLNEETRCDFLISHEMKKVWAVELDLLSEFDRVCKKYHIKYFASGGTMLGAVRHKGFIPWDDDIDLMMMRDDYDRLCKIAPLEFKHPYFFQNGYTDPGAVVYGHAKLRNSDTAAISKKNLYKTNTNSGVFIDIFPLDSVIPTEHLFTKQGKKAKRYLNIAVKLVQYSFCFVPNTGKPIKDFFRNILYWLVNNPFKRWTDYKPYYQKFDETCKKYNDQETELISTLSFRFFEKQHFKYRDDYKEIIECNFEFLKIPLGAKFDHALKTRYGNYMEPIKGSQCHSGYFFNTDKSYKEL